MNEKSLDWNNFAKELSPTIPENKINKEWLNAVDSIKRKIIVLDLSLIHISEPTRPY